MGLSTCQLHFYFNGATTAGTTIQLVGTLLVDDVYTVCDNDLDPLVYDPASSDLTSTGTFFNGDDAIELTCGGVTLDVIGQIGVDPGSEWNVGGVGTADESIRRDCAVTVGDANGADAFDPSLEWTTAAQDDFSDLGQYSCP